MFIICNGNSWAEFMEAAMLDCLSPEFSDVSGTWVVPVPLDLDRDKEMMEFDTPHFF